MAMAMAATARGPSLTKIPHLPQTQRFHASKPFSLPPRSLSAPIAKLEESSKQIQAMAPATATGAALLAALSSCDQALAAQQVMELADSDNRGSLLLLPLVPAIGWVVYNILQPALNQINRMRTKGAVAWAVLGGGGAAGILAAPEEASAEVDKVVSLAAEAASNDNRGLLLLLVITPAIGWVLFNILQPALNQINKMRSG